MALPHFMNRMPLHRRWAVWLMLCVMGLGAALPTVSRAAAWASAGAWVEICSANGAAQWVRGAADASVDIPADAPVALSLDHCPFCLQPSDRGAAPPPQLPYLFLVQGGNQERPVWQAFFFSSTDFLAAAPRGPPAKA